MTRSTFYLWGTGPTFLTDGERDWLTFDGGPVERVSILELMDGSLVDDVSDRNSDRADGVADAGRHLAASIPNEGSLVRRGERPRVRRASSSTQRPRFRTAAQRKAFREGRATNVQEAAERRLADTIASYGGTPYVAPTDKLNPCIDYTHATSVRHIGLNPMAEDIFDLATDAVSVPMFEVADLPDTYVPMGRNADLERMANALLARDGFFGDCSCDDYDCTAPVHNTAD